MAEGRDGLGAVQCLRALLETARPSTAHQPQDRRDQEPQSCQINSTRPEKEGKRSIHAFFGSVILTKLLSSLLSRRTVCLPPDLKLEHHPLALMHNGDLHTSLLRGPPIDPTRPSPEQIHQVYIMTQTLLHNTYSME
jgi:hypothetical protein